MESNKLPEEISRLVDHLRSQPEQNFSLTDVASVTEVLVGTMVAYFSSIDASIYNECRNLSEYIAGARDEIAALAPGDDDDSHIPRAGKELDAIVKSTEEATETIMSSAEEIMNALGEDDLEGQRTKIESAVMEIFEACSFQDITGQRISKVVETFTHIEGRIDELTGLMGVTEDDILAAKGKAEEKANQKHDPLARGPQLEGEGIEQDEIDALLNEGFEQPTPPPPPAPEQEAEQEPAPEVKAEPEAKEEKKKEDKPAAKPAPDASDSDDDGEIDQAAIDALFD